MNNENELTCLGWSDAWEAAFAPHRAQGLRPGRVLCQQRRLWMVAWSGGELLAEATGGLLYAAEGRGELPAVGDWVALTPRPDEGRGAIHAVLPRRTRVSRKVAGTRTEEQVLAANVDTALLVVGLDRDFNVRRIERYVASCRAGGTRSVVLLNKSDLCREVPVRLSQAESVAPQTPVHAISAADGLGLEALSPWLAPGQTLVVLGSSGAGKSTLINRLLGEARQAVGPVRAGDGRGRHTTVRRELIALPGGALLIDTPGLRELALWADESDLQSGFEDIEQLAARCRFRDCTHAGEPSCAVQAALADGRLAAERLEGFRQLVREVRYLQRRQDQRLERLEKERWKKIHRQHRRMPKRPC